MAYKAVVGGLRRRVSVKIYKEQPSQVTCSRPICTSSILAAWRDRTTRTMRAYRMQRVSALIQPPGPKAYERSVPYAVVKKTPVRRNPLASTHGAWVN
jgi:hypothetical protein